MVFKHLTHSDINNTTKKRWKEDKGQISYYLKNGFKTTVSTALIPLGVVGIFDSFSHNPIFASIFGADGFLISVIALILGVLNIWICDRIYEHYLLKKEEKNIEREERTNKKLSEQEKTIQDLTQQIAEQQAKILVDEKTQEILKEQLKNLTKETETNRNIETELKNVIDRFMKDMNQ